MGAEAEATSAARAMIPAVSVESPVQVRQALERARAARAGFDNAWERAVQTARCRRSHIAGPA
jgi:hypothetical protein